MTRFLRSLSFATAASAAIATLVVSPAAAQQGGNEVAPALYSPAEIATARARMEEYKVQQRAVFEMLEEAAYRRQALAAPGDAEARAHLDAVINLLELRFERLLDDLDDLPGVVLPSIAELALEESTYLLETLTLAANPPLTEATTATCGPGDTDPPYPQSCIDKWFVEDCKNQLGNTCLLNICHGVLGALLAVVETLPSDIEVFAAGFGANIPSIPRIIASVLLQLGKIACNVGECFLIAEDNFCGPYIEELMALTYLEKSDAYWPFDPAVAPNQTLPSDELTRRDVSVVQLPFVEWTIDSIEAHTVNELNVMEVALRGSSPGDDHTTLFTKLIGTGEPDPVAPPIWSGDLPDPVIDHADLDRDLDAGIALGEEAAGQVADILTTVDLPENPTPTLTSIASLLAKIVSFDDSLALESTVISLAELYGTPQDPPQPDQDTLFELAEKILSNFPDTESMRAGAGTSGGLTQMLWLETGLLDESDTFRGSRLEEDGGSAERIRQLVWETIGAYFELGIYPVQSGLAAVRADAADQLLLSGRLEQAYREYCRAYQALIPNDTPGGFQQSSLPSGLQGESGR